MRSILNYILSRNVVPITPGIVLEAAKGVLDARIWAAARLNQIPLLSAWTSQMGRFLKQSASWIPSGPPYGVVKSDCSFPIVFLSASGQGPANRPAQGRQTGTSC
jgi:hypothetical protein